MASRKIGGKPNTKYQDFLNQFLENNSGINKYEVRIIMKAFKKTLRELILGLQEFEIGDFFKFKKIHKKAMGNYVRYRDEYQIIPEHDDMKFEVHKNLKDYLNKRNKYKNVRHRERFPDGTIINEDIWGEK